MSMSVSLPKSPPRPLVELEDACGNYLEGEVDSREPIQKIHDATSGLIVFGRAFSPWRIPTIKALVTSVEELDIASSATPLQNPATFNAVTKKTLMLTRRAMHLLRESPSPCSTPVADPTPFVLPKAKIGVADDEAAPRKMLAQKILPNFSIGPIPAAISGTDTVENLLTIYGDTLEILFLDNNMPELTGVDIIQITRKNSIWSKITVLFLTADSSFNHTWKSLGFDGYLKKPITKQDVELCLTNVYTRLSSSSDPADERRWVTNNKKKNRFFK